MSCNSCFLRSQEHVLSFQHKFDTTSIGTHSVLWSVPIFLAGRCNFHLIRSYEFWLHFGVLSFFSSGILYQYQVTNLEQEWGGGAPHFLFVSQPSVDLSTTYGPPPGARPSSVHARYVPDGHWVVGYSSIGLKIAILCPTLTC